MCSHQTRNNTELGHGGLRNKTIGLEAIESSTGINLCVNNVYIEQFYASMTYPTRGLGHTDHGYIFFLKQVSVCCPSHGTLLCLCVSLLRHPCTLSPTGSVPWWSTTSPRVLSRKGSKVPLVPGRLWRSSLRWKVLPLSFVKTVNSVGQTP